VRGKSRTGGEAGEKHLFHFDCGAHFRPSRYHFPVRKPNYGKQRSASGSFSLSRTLPKLNLPSSIVTAKPNKMKSPKVGKAFTVKPPR
jgi:hypothetical protein